MLCVWAFQKERCAANTEHKNRAVMFENGCKDKVFLQTFQIAENQKILEITLSVIKGKTRRIVQLCIIFC